MTIKELLQEYNAIAPTPLKAWKGKREDLQAKIEAIQATVKNSNVKTLITKTNGAKLDGTLSVVQIASELNINPKVARAKLRRKGEAATNGRWNLVKRNSAEHKAIVATLGA